MPSEIAIIVEPDQNRRHIMTLMVRAATLIDVNAFGTFDDAADALQDHPSKLIICPWQDGGRVLLTQRLTRPTSAQQAHLLILSETITSEHIAMCQRAGNTHLIPSASLNLNALRNRIVLQMEGPTSLAARMTQSGMALRDALANLPALRRRLAL